LSRRRKELRGAPKTAGP